MMYVEKHNIIDLVPDTTEGLKDGLFEDYGFAVSDYLEYRGFTRESLIDDIRHSLKDEFLIAAAITNNTTLDDIKDWLKLNEGYSVVIIDFHILEPTQEKTELLDLISNMLNEHLHDLCSYIVSFAFCKMNDIN